MSALVTIQNLTSSGTFSPAQLNALVWGLNYQALYQYNRSPWVERGYAVPASAVKLADPTTTAIAWNVELLDDSTQEGALGWHEDFVPVQSTPHSTRGLAAGTEKPLAKVFCHTAAVDGVAPSEVASHEILEMLVDPYVVDESRIRKYLNTVAKEWYIGEVGDPCQGRGYDVGAPEKRPTGVIVADFAYPGWWKVAQTRLFTTAAEEFGLAPRLEPWELAPGGYMSVAPENEPTAWTQIYGSDRHKAEAASHAYERAGE